MAESNGISFEELNHSNLIAIPSKDDKNVKLTLNVFRGNASFTIFEGAGGKPWNFSLPPKIQAGLLILLKKLYANVRVCAEPIMINTWVEADGRWTSKQMGCIKFGIDETMTFFIDVQHQDLTKRHMFLMKPDTKTDFSQSSLTEQEIVQGSIQNLITVFSITLPVAERLSSVKRQPPAGGGNRGGYNNNRGGGGGGNRGGYNNGGGGYNNNRGSQASGGTFGNDGDSDIHV